MSYLPYHTLGLSELRQWELPEREWIIDGLVPTGSLSLLSGREKAGKSLFLIDMVASVASGDPFLGRDTRSAPAGLLFLEDNPGDIRARIDTRLPGAEDVPLYFIPADGSVEQVHFSLADDESLDQLAATIEYFRLKLLAIDPLRETHNFAENEADQMAPMIRPLRQLAHQLNVAIVIAHHQNKSGESRGSTAIRASVDQELHWKVDEETRDLRGRLRVVGRCGPKQLVEAAYDGCGRFEAGEQASDRVQEPDLLSRVLTILQGSTSMLSAPDVASALGEDGYSIRSEGSVRNALTRLSESGAITFENMDGKGSPRLYRAADPWDDSSTTAA